MKLIPFIIPLMAVFTRAIPYNVKVDNEYNFAGSSTNITAPACAYKLGTPYPRLGNFPIFPNIAGSTLVVTGADTSQCGSCWRLTYTTNSGPDNGNMKTTSINVAVINDDQSATPTTQEFSISQQAFYALVGPGSLANNIPVNAEPINGVACFPPQ